MDSYGRWKGLATLLQFSRTPLADQIADLIATARGDKKATLVITNGTLVNVCSGEILKGMSAKNFR
ncbi:hypothetical protein FPL14_24240 [Cohnella cholangitidis]|uniref:Uncharacterized protein n=1 Tax=Cohnella cholangitidis TaxID=2598458 RepID=A0A7G5C400_9BACL|nr:hypothetical protein FPL14_24240 [Cohnella cholangitidis]